MLRRSPTLASIGVAIVLSACGGIAAEPVASEPSVQPTASAAGVASSPADASATASPVLAWTFGDGSVAESLTGTWDYVNDEAGREVILANFAGLVDSADEVVTRIGFDGNDWWQGFLFDGELFLLHGVPEGDGGSFFLVPDEAVIAMVGAHGQAQIVYEWAIDADSLTLTAIEECSLAGREMSCTKDQSEMDPVMLLVTDQTFTRSGDDPSH